MRHPSWLLLVASLALPTACGDDDIDASSSSGSGGGVAVASSSSVGGQPAAGGGGTAGVGGSGGQPATTRVRVVAANLTSGNDQSYDGGHGIRILSGIDADVILLQEMSYGNDSAAAMSELTAEICADCAYVRGPGVAHPNGIPNGIITRLPVLESGHWVDPEVDNRTFVWARLDAPGSRDLWAISVHLLASNATDRDAEAEALLTSILATIPQTDFMILGGDLNTNNRNEFAINTLASVFATSGPYPRDQDGNSNTNEPRSRPYDWVLDDTDLSPRRGATVIGGQSFPTGAVIDTRVYTPLSDISPAQVGDSGVPGMQHMAVVRDYFL